MAVGSATNLISYAGNGSDTTPYPIPFRYDDAAWLTVNRYDADGTLTTLEMGVDYELSGNGVAATGQLTTTAAVPAESSLVIARTAPPFQLLDLIPNAPLPAEDLERALDRIVMAMQDRLRTGGGEIFAKSLTFPLIEPADHATQLPLPHLRKDTLTYFDPDTGELAVMAVVDLAERILGMLGLEGGGPGGSFGRLDAANTWQEPNNFEKLTTFKGQVSFETVPLADGASIAWDASLGNIASVMLEGNRTLANPTNIEPGTYILKVAQNDDGGRTLAYGSNFRFPAGEAPVLSTAPEATDILTFVNFGGSELFLVAQTDFLPATP